jgi:hypothetical protein
LSRRVTDGNRKTRNFGGTDGGNYGASGLRYRQSMAVAHHHLEDAVAMAKPIKPLNPSQVQNARPKEAPYKLRDGNGLYLLVNPRGGKAWRYEYRRPATGQRNTISLGTYPEVPLSRARERLAEARRLLAEGCDPSDHRKATALRSSPGSTKRRRQRSAPRERPPVPKLGWSSTSSP